MPTRSAADLHAAVRLSFAGQILGFTAGRATDHPPIVDLDYPPVEPSEVPTSQCADSYPHQKLRRMPRKHPPSFGLASVRHRSQPPSMDAKLNAGTDRFEIC